MLTNKSNSLPLVLTPRCFILPNRNWDLFDLALFSAQFGSCTQHNLHFNQNWFIFFYDFTISYYVTPNSNVRRGAGAECRETVWGPWMRCRGDAMRRWRAMRTNQWSLPSNNNKTHPSRGENKIYIRTLVKVATIFPDKVKIRIMHRFQPYLRIHT